MMDDVEEMVETSRAARQRQRKVVVEYGWELADEYLNFDDG